MKSYSNKQKEQFKQAVEEAIKAYDEDGQEIDGDDRYDVVRAVMNFVEGIAELHLTGFEADDIHVNSEGKMELDCDNFPSIDYSVSIPSLECSFTVNACHHTSWDYYITEIVDTSLESLLQKDVESMFRTIVSDDYITDILDNLLEDIVEDVKCASDFQNGDYNEDDIRLAIGRVLSERLGIER